ncbi:MAG TPA: MGMT family protein [Acidimicrobiales bacterium]|nr:MGMT family protein [Acidimicrobiales bacterium]
MAIVAVIPGDFHLRVIAALSLVAPGEVISYGDLAAEAGSPGAARGAGAVLASSADVAWWRVVYADGRLAPGKEPEQSRRLVAEGVTVRGGRVVTVPTLRTGLRGHRRLRREAPEAAR